DADRPRRRGGARRPGASGPPLLRGPTPGGARAGPGVRVGGVLGPGPVVRGPPRRVVGPGRRSDVRGERRGTVPTSPSRGPSPRPASRTPGNGSAGGDRTGGRGPGGGTVGRRTGAVRSRPAAGSVPDPQPRRCRGRGG